MNRPLVINWVLPEANLSGGAKSNRLLGEAMVRRGHEVRLIYPDVPRPWPPPTRPRRWYRRLRHELNVRGRQAHHLEHSTVDLMPLAEKPIRGGSVPDADFAIATWWETRNWIDDWPASKGEPVYMIRGHELHGGDPERVARTYTMPGQKFVISRWLERVMVETYGDDGAVLVSNGVDRSQFGAPSRSKSDEPTVGLLYGVSKWKGAETAFEAIRLAQQKVPGLRVIAFGSKQLDKRAVLPDHLEFHLRPSQKEIPELYRRCDCWLVPSTSEGFGMPGIEAAACRCPIVSTRCGGPEDYVEDGVNGRLVDVGNARAMASSILDVLGASQDEWQRMSRASQEISLRFDWDRSASIMDETLTRLLVARDAAQTATRIG